jgi:hypothetical protein
MKLQTQLVIAFFSAATLVADEPRVIIPTLSLEQEIYISDTNGVINASNIIRLKPTDNIKFYLSDGTELVGLVKETQEYNKEMFKVFGDIQNKPNSGFGFVLAKEGVISNEGIFAGAVVFRDTDETYTLQYSEAAKGYLLIKSKGKKTDFKFAKKSSKNNLTAQKSVL